MNNKNETKPAKRALASKGQDDLGLTPAQQQKKAGLLAMLRAGIDLGFPLAQFKN